ncbi:MAG: HEAT repeat domain-containing protein [Pirellulales bacterium]
MQLSQWRVALEQPGLTFDEAGALANGFDREWDDVEPLAELLAHRRAPVRYAAALALKRVNVEFDSATVDELLAAIDDPHPKVAVAAIRALGSKRVGEARGELLECLEMTQPDIQAAALEALVAMGTDELEGPINRHLESSVPTLVRAAAKAISHQELRSFAPALLATLVLRRELARADDSKGTPWVSALRGVIDALGRLRYVEAVPLLTELAGGHFGLRTASLIALSRLGVTIDQMAIDAYQQLPSGHMRALLASRRDERPADSESPAAADSGAGPSNARRIRSEMRLAENRSRLIELGDNLRVGQVQVADVLYVGQSYALVELIAGISARLDAAEVSWQPVRNLKRRLSRGDRLTVVVTEIVVESGQVSVSVRQLRPDPWPDLAERLVPGTEHVGQVESIAGFGVFIRLEPEVVGLIHRSSLPLTDDQSLEDYFPADGEVRVRIVEIQLEERRLKLELVSNLPNR